MRQKVDAAGIEAGLQKRFTAFQSATGGGPFFGAKSLYFFRNAFDIGFCVLATF